jgi:hypothetical protein
MYCCQRLNTWLNISLGSEKCATNNYDSKSFRDITYLTAWNIRAAKSAYRNPEV